MNYDYSPWGRILGTRNLAKGIKEIRTVAGGGFKLDSAQNLKVHQAWRKAGGWYEQECEWSIVFLTFPELFENALTTMVRTSGAIEVVKTFAHETAKENFPFGYKQAIGSKESK
jgi:hypothetical protein